MGYSAYGYTVLGVKLSEGDVMVDTPYKIGKHNHPPEMKFDPTTGKKLWDTYKGNIFDGAEGEPRRENLPEGIGFTADAFEGDYNVYLGLVLQDGGPIKITPELLSDLQAKLKGLLEPRGLWDSQAFGLYSFTYESY
jgi:hypothetical protein